ncbi:MAG: InlB B-repeat-containing protein [Clostridiales bacterium]|nr:InlB B-repeat-containing protein [Clostridiales bacterium]
MPISDEVIELAPVKKTKTTLIIMIVGMAVCFALAAAFLVMYLLKPSVTEDKNHVKDVTVVANELFSELDENGHEVLYASIGNEYIVYSTITVDNNSSTNVKWDWSTDLLEIKEQEGGDGAYIKFIPRVGTHGKTAYVTAVAAQNSHEHMKVEFKIVNQGAEDVRVKQYGSSGSWHTVTGDNSQKELAISVPYYKNNANFNTTVVRFEQLGRYNATSGEYSKMTESDLGGGKKTNDVSITSDNDKVVINQDSIINGEFSFTAKGSDLTAIITISANVNNDNFEVLNKKIKVTVQSNATLGYVDTMYMFNKPVVDGPYIAGVLKDGDTRQIDSAALSEKLKADKSLKVSAYNDRTVGSKDFEIVLPYSNNSNVTYNDIFKHIMLNPATIQYNGNQLNTAWHKDIEVSSSDNNVLTVTTDRDGEVKLYPKAISDRCTLTFKDKKSGSAGASLTVPVRIVAQTLDVVLAEGDNKTSEGHPNIDVNAATDRTYTVTISYTFVAPDNANLEGCVNNKYALSFSKSELKVMLGASEEIEPNEIKEVKLTPTKSGGQGSSTQYKASFTLSVKVLKNDTGVAKLTFIKQASDLAEKAENSDSLLEKDKQITLSASFGIVESAQEAWLKDRADVLDFITDDGANAADYIRKSNQKEADLYVQNRRNGVQLNMVTTADNLKKFVAADKTYFTVQDINVGSASGALTKSNNNLVFRGSETVNPSVNACTISFAVHNVNGTKIADLSITVHVFDAVDSVIVSTKNKQAYYGVSDANAITEGYIEIQSSDVKATYVYNQNEKDFDFSGIDLYYGNNVKFEDGNKQISGNTITFLHEGTPLYEFNTSTKRLTAKTDIFEYSYKTGINFGDLYMVFLLGDSDEYVGKHYGEPFDYGNQKMTLKFIRRADEAALFDNGDYDGSPTLKGGTGFELSFNQDKTYTLYVSSVIKINVSGSEGKQSIYAEQHSDVAPYEQAWIVLPDQITDIRDESSGIKSTGSYYYVTFKTPAIQGNKISYNGKVFLTSEKSVNAVFEISNQTRSIQSISIFEDASHGKVLDNKTMSLGAYVGSDGNVYKYSKEIYVLITYIGNQSYYTKFESATIKVPDYLEISGATLLDDQGSDDGYDYYSLTPSVEKINESTIDHFICTITLSKTKQVTDCHSIQAYPSDQQAGDIKAGCSVDVQTGLDKITVKSGEADIATVTSGSTAKTSKAFELASKNDTQSYTLTFVYGAINGEGYDLSYNYAGSGLSVVSPSAFTGFVVNNNIKGDNASTFTITVDPTSITTLLGVNNKLTFTFTDTYHEVSRVFTLEIEISVTMDIYALDFVDNTEKRVTVTGGSGNANALSVNVKYNDGDSNVQPPETTINNQQVLFVCTYDGSDYTPFGGITVTHNGAQYSITVPNNIDRNTKYYLVLEYQGKTYKVQELIIDTLISSLQFASGNTIQPTGDELIKEASVVVKSKDQQFTLAAQVVNAGSGQVDSGKTATYKLYTDVDLQTEVSGITIDGSGVIKFTAPAKTSGEFYYVASYSDQYTANATLKVKIAYTITPSEVNIENVDEEALSGNKLTLYFVDDGHYTIAELHDKLVAKTVFGTKYEAESVSYRIELQDTGNSRYLEVSGLKLTPKSLIGNSVTTVPVIVYANYNDVEVQHTYNVVITPIAKATFGAGNSTLDLLNKDASLTVEPTISNYAGFNTDFSLTGADGVLKIDNVSSSNNKTVKFASGTTAKRGTYDLTATLTYTYTGAGNGIRLIGDSFTVTSTYTVTVVCDYELTFDLNATLSGDSNAVPVFQVGSEETKFAVTNGAMTFGITVTSVADDSKFSATYSAQCNTEIVTVKSFTGKTAVVVYNNNTSGKFTITVTANIYGDTFKCAQDYYFVYGADVSATLSISSDGGSQYSAFEGSTQNIEYTTNPYKFKYEVSGLPNDAVVDIVVNGDVEKSEIQSTSGKKYVIITAVKPTTLIVGGTVKIGSRTIYLADKTVTLTATAPDFNLNCASESVLPAGTAQFSVTKASGFTNGYTVTYSVESETYGSITETGGKFTAAKNNVLTDQTVVVKATVTVPNGIYAGEYTLTKVITVKGVPLPTVSWKDGANADLTVGTAKDYSELYEVIKQVTGYTYTTINPTLSVAGLNSGEYDISGLSLTVKNITTGKLIRVTVTATIGDDIHNGESVSATVIVRVKPEMNGADSNIKLGNAQNGYDLNDSRFKGIFAPDGVATSAYKIVSLTVSDQEHFNADGSRLLVTTDLSSSVTYVDVTATVLITSGDFVGMTVTGTKRISFTFLNTADLEHTFRYSDGYADLTVNSGDISCTDGTISGTVQRMDVIVPAAVAKYVTVANDGTTAPKISVAKEYGAYLTSGDSSKTFTLTYIITYKDTDDNIYVYHNTVQYTVDTYRVTVSATMGDGTVNAGGTASINAGETAIMRLNASDGYTVVVTGVSTETSYLTATYGGNGVQFTAEEVTSDHDVSVTVNLTVAGFETSFSCTVKVMAPQTTSQYTATETDHIDFAVNDGTDDIVQNNSVVSVWSAAQSANYKYAQSITITAPTGHNLNEYFTSLKVNDNDNLKATLTGNSAIVYLYNNQAHNTQTNSFNLNMTFKTDAPIELSTIEVKLTTYNRGMGGNPYYVTVLYRVRVTGQIDVTLNYNAGDDNVECASYTKPLYKHQYKLPNPTRKGYTFDGWYTAEKDGTPVQSTDKVTNMQPHTLYARWTARTYTLKYNANYDDAPAIPDASDKITYGQPYGNLTAPTRDGYDFIGWTVAASATSQAVTENTLVKPETDTVTEITLYAQWRIKYYTVTIDAGDDNATVDGANRKITVDVKYNDSFALHTLLTPTWANHRFTGWSSSGVIEHVTGNMTITAQWVETFTVTLNAGAGKIGSSDKYVVTLDKGTSYSDYVNIIPVRADYRFDGWYTSAESGVLQTAAVTSTTELFAHWTPIVFTVTLIAGEGAVDGERVKVITVSKSGDSYTVSLGEYTPMRTGYTFDGWYTGKDGDGERKENTITITSDITLYANWTVNKYMLKYNANYTEAPAIDETRQVTFGQAFGELKNDVSREGYRFVCWTIAAESSSQVITAASMVTSDLQNGADLILYAQWEKLYTVSFDLNYGENPPSQQQTFQNQTYANGEKYILPTPTRDGYTFDGWYTGVADGNKIENGSTVQLENDQQLHARWTQVVFTVTLKAVGEGKTLDGENSTLTFKVKNADELKKLLDLIKPTVTDDDEFDGWYTLEQEGEKWQGNDELTGDIILYARWNS